MARQENSVAVINAFAEWCYPEGQMRFWSKPTTFDFMFLASYFEDNNLQNPFHYREATDLNSFLRGLYYPSNINEIEVPFSGDAHNALADTLHQLKVLFAHLDTKQ